ncbi:MAG: glycosyltransferase [Verrucomicrobia bacterium]|nr:glycosyltransferase [Verrucomicrobiota bacterium]
MNILFVNYGDFTTNSLNHIGGFANTLCAAGHACVVAVPARKETLVHLARPLFIAATYDEALALPKLFPDGRPADVIHAWTPREGVRKFVLAYQRKSATPARLLIHLEDHERFLLEAYTGRTFAALRDASLAETAAWLVDGLPHPVRHESFLRIADGVTHIVEKLREFVPPGTPTQLLPPGVDFSLYSADSASASELASLRAELGLKDDERVLVFTGSNTFANEPEMRELYVAVALLNQRGTPTRLIRTGFNSPSFLAGLSDDLKRHVLDLGFVEKAKLPRLLALADVLVQPGRPGAFNDYRLPSKLPEFLAIGRPVILPPTNLALAMSDGHEAVFLSTGTPEDIAATCEKLFADEPLRASLAENGAAFARRHFDLAANTRALAAFYEATLARPAIVDWSLARVAATDEVTLLSSKLARSVLAANPDAVAAETDLLGRVARDQIERLEATSAARARDLLAERDAVLAREQLTQQHVKNIEALLGAARENVAALEKARDMTQAHADNVARDLEKHKIRRDQADALLRSARQQVTAYENAILKADAEIVELQRVLAVTEEALVLSRDETRVSREAHTAESAALRAERAAEVATLQQQHAAQLAALQTDAAHKLAHAEAIIRSREQKIATMQASFSWKVTWPFRALRRAFFDQPAPPAVAPQLLGNIDYPQDWSQIPPTLNVRGWSLHRDRVVLKAARARLGDKSCSCEFGLERLDVLDHFRDFPGAERCGWIVKVDVPRYGTHQLIIEVQDAAGAWHIAVSRTVKRTADAAPPPPNTYAAWCAAYDTLTPETADRIRQKLTTLKKRPLISVVMPVYNTKPEQEKWLVEAIESVRRQLYDNWELCIADDASKAPHVRKVLAAYQKKDPQRIKVVYREHNGHICATSNSALELAHGEFIALLDNDDVIRPHALACVALELDAHPDADLIYSDEDKIDENGHRYDHYFKPDWNPDLYNVQNYISHLGVYRTLLVREVGGFRVGYEGSQDWDLAHRVIERTAPDRIRHIPKILYHWRSVPGSTAMLIGAKDYARIAAEKVITEHFIRGGIDAKLSPTKGSYWRVHYPLPDPAPRVTLIIPTRNRLNVLKPCVESLLEKTTYPNFELLIVDNDSDEPETLEYLRTLASGTGLPTRDSSATGQETRATRALVRVVHFPGEFNYSAINNHGVTHTDAPLVGLLNNDLEVIHGDWLDEMVSHALRPEIGCVGAKLYYPDDRIQHAGVILGIGGVAAHAWQTHPRGAAGQAHRNLLQQNLCAVTAACLVIRREVYQQVGGLNADQLKVAFNDVDFCLKVRAAGFRNLWTPYAELYHHESASRGKEDTLEKRDRFRTEVEYMRSTWGEILDNDPAYNPNLTLTINDFTLSLPPRPWPPLDQ